MFRGFFYLFVYFYLLFLEILCGFISSCKLCRSFVQISTRAISLLLWFIADFFSIIVLWYIVPDVDKVSSNLRPKSRYISDRILSSTMCNSCPAHQS